MYIWYRELCEPLELQLDYWLLPGKPGDPRGDSVGGGGEKKKGDSSKSTLKSTFRALQVARLSLSGEQPTPHFTINYSTKEKKQKSRSFFKEGFKENRKIQEGLREGKKEHWLHTLTLDESQYLESNRSKSSVKNLNIVLSILSLINFANFQR